jgi:hemolysin D
MRRSDFLAFQPTVVAALDTPPARLARIVSIVVVLFVVVAALWSWHSRIDIVVSAHGEIVHTGKAKRVQAAETGVIRQIHVRDGQRVRAGEVLLELDDTASLADRDDLSSQRSRLLLSAQRLRAELGEAVTIGDGVDTSAALVERERQRLIANRRAFDERLDRLDSDIGRAEAAVNVSQRESDALSLRIEQRVIRLAEKREQVIKGLITRQEGVDAEYELESLRKELEVFEERTLREEIALTAAREASLAETSEHRSRLLAELADAENQIERLSQEQVKADERMLRQKIRSPVDGTVQELVVTTIGGVVEHGDPVMAIVPLEAGMQLDIRVANKDAGFVASGQPVRIKVNAFEFTRYGTLDGELQWVGGDALVDEHEGMVYPARVVLAGTALPNRVDEHRAAVVPGMQATADIVIGERRLAEYFLAPLLRYRDESLRER